MYDAKIVSWSEIKNELFLIQREHMLAIWPKVEPMLLPAIELSDGRWDKWAVLSGLINGQMDLWVSMREGKPDAALIGRVLDFPCMRVYSLPWLGGKVLKNWWHFEPQIVAYAQSKGCKEIEGYMRQGFRKLLPHWKFSWVFARRSL